MTPTVILTRPKAQSESFSADLAAAWGQPINIIVSPLMQIKMKPVALPDVAGVIFSSANGVKAAKGLKWPLGLPAWCVGERTAALATSAGFVAKTGPGDAVGLVNDIIRAQPSGRIAHFRGTHTRGDVAKRLQDAGLACVDVVAYDQVARDLTSEATAALSGSIPVILPLFSPRTSTILKGQGPFAAPIRVVAMSDAVKAAIDPGPQMQVVVAQRPDRDAMIDALLMELVRIVT